MMLRQRGIALLIVLWTVGFLALLGTRIVAAGRSDTRLADNIKEQAVLQAAADGAVANVMFAILAARDPSVRPDGQVHEVRIGPTPVLVRVRNESDRININTASSALMRALIVDVGGPPAAADRLATDIADWRATVTDTGQAAALATRYRAAGLSYGPPGTPFQGVEELADVLGMTHDLFERLAPHLTVLTAQDPDMSTRDAIVARALTDAAGLDEAAGAPPPARDGTARGDAVLRVTATAVGPGNARCVLLVVASANFRSATPRINILLRHRLNRDAEGDVVASGSGPVYFHWEM